MKNNPINRLCAADLESEDIIKRLMLKDHELIHDIASSLYSKLLPVFITEIPTINNWDRREEKLKWVLRSQVELLGHLCRCEDTIESFLTAKGNAPGKLLEEVTYEFYFLSQDLSLLFQDLGYSTWNLIDFLDPDHYFGLKALTPALSAMIDNVLPHAQPGRSVSFHSLRDQWIDEGVDRRTIELTEESLRAFLAGVQRYKQSITIFYNAQTSIEVLYAFHCVFSVATYLLSISLNMKLVLKPLRNQIHPVSAPEND
jgi:hypothetical protein